MNPKRLAAIDREARRLAEQFEVTRQAVLVTVDRADDPSFRHAVVTRVRQILAGDTGPLVDLEDD